MSEVVVETQEQLLVVLDQISFAPSCVNMGWQWQIEELRSPSGNLRGWLVNTTFRRHDTNTGEIGIGSGRKELIAYGASETAVVKTVWLLVELIVRHELMEAFLYRGVRIFNPHHTVDERFPYGIAPHTVELTAMVDKGRCAACTLEFTDWRAKEVRDRAVQIYLADHKDLP